MVELFEASFDGAQFMNDSEDRLVVWGQVPPGSDFERYVLAAASPPLMSADKEEYICLYLPVFYLKFFDQRDRGKRV